MSTGGRTMDDVGKKTNRCIFDLPFRFAESSVGSGFHTGWFDRLKIACEEYFGKNPILTFGKIEEALKSWDKKYPANDCHGPGGIIGPNKLYDGELLDYLWPFAKYGLIIFEDLEAEK